MTEAWPRWLRFSLPIQRDRFKNGAINFRPQDIEASTYPETQYIGPEIFWHQS